VVDDTTGDALPRTGPGSLVALAPMAEANLPVLDSPDEAPKTTQHSSLPERRSQPKGRSFTKLLLDVTLIAVGVFLGLAGEQWRENAEHRDNARVALERFRKEISTNRSEVARVMDYHASTRERLKTYLRSSPEQRKAISVKIEGVKVVRFERTAWDLALSTGSLGYIDRDLAFSLSSVYNVQDMHAGLSQGFTQAMYIRPPAEDLDGFLAAMAVYFDDIVDIEPKLLGKYDKVLHDLERTLGSASPR
jgi:hypothetical protein